MMDGLNFSELVVLKYSVCAKSVALADIEH